MKKYKLISLVLVFSFLFQIMPVIAANTKDVNLYPTNDTYIEGSSRWESKNYGNEQTMLFGKNYDRTALLKFDLSSIDLSQYNGALLNVTLSAASEQNMIEAYIVNDVWAENDINYKTFVSEYDFIVSSNIVKGGGQRLSLNVNAALEYAKNENLKSISIALKSSAGCVTAFSSETPNVSLRPSLLLTEMSAFINGQYDFKFPEVTKQQLKNELQKAIAKGHPYMIANNEYINKVKEYAFGKDEFLTEQYSLLKESALNLLDSELVDIAPEISSAESFIGDGVQFWNNILTLSLIYLVEGDVRFAQRAYEQAENVCKLKSWGTYQRIDLSQLQFGLAICYDWLYDWLSTEQKNVIVNGAKSLDLNQRMDIYHNPTDPKYKWGFYKALFGTGNHELMNSTCGFLAAMSFADADIDWSAEFMEYAVTNLQSSLKGLYPDGIWAEGATYWNFVGPYVARWLQALLSAFGHAFGYEDLPMMSKLGNYPLCIEGDQGPFITGNSYSFTTNFKEPIFYLLGVLADDINIQTFAVEQAKKRKTSDAIFILMYDTEKSYDQGLNLEKDIRLRGTADIVTMRSSWQGNQNIFAGMDVHASSNNVNGFADRGTLAFDALGERWITNHGRENYYKGYNNGTEERWTWYRTRAESQSCIVIDPSEYRGQELTGGVTMHSFETDSGGAYATADLTKVYEPQVNSYWRGIQLADNRKVFVVQDEIAMKKPSELYSFFNIYQADIEVLSDGKSAILSKNNKKIYVTVDCDKDFELGYMYAEPLPESAHPDTTKPNSPNNEFLKLYVHFDNVEDVNIRVSFMPYLSEEELSQMTCSEFVPMSQWKAPSELKLLPMLEGIKVDGTDIVGFDAYDRCYNVEKELSASQVEPVYDKTKYDVEIKKDSETGAVNILLTDKFDRSNMNSYSLSQPVIPQPSYVDTSNMSVLPIIKTVAPEPQPENSINNMYDNDLATRWSGEGAGTVMTIELDKLREVGCIAVNIYLGNIRKQYFDVKLSDDSKTWTNAGRFSTCGASKDTEYFDLGNTKAKYIQVIWNTNSASAWNSITELKFYGN